jgi:hypothetical protein
MVGLHSTAVGRQRSAVGSRRSPMVLEQVTDGTTRLSPFRTETNYIRSRSSKQKQAAAEATFTTYIRRPRVSLLNVRVANSCRQKSGHQRVHTRRNGGMETVQRVRAAAEDDEEAAAAAGGGGTSSVRTVAVSAYSITVSVGWSRRCSSNSRHETNFFSSPSSFSSTISATVRRDKRHDRTSSSVTGLRTDGMHSKQSRTGSVWCFLLLVDQLTIIAIVGIGTVLHVVIRRHRDGPCLIYAVEPMRRCP